MRNGKNTKISRIIEAVRRLPVFTLDDLASLETDKKYLRILLARHTKSRTFTRLKKGMYVANDYINSVEKAGRLREYAEFLAGILYKPSYLSLEYILHQYNIITESPVAVTAISRKKTTSFSRTPFGVYKYHSIAPALFIGFTTKREGDYLIFRASAAKALFDFLYFRKGSLTNVEAIKALRLNLDYFHKSEKKELERYVALEGSMRMKKIFETLWKK